MREKIILGQVGIHGSQICWKERKYVIHISFIIWFRDADLQENLLNQF